MRKENWKQWTSKTRAKKNLPLHRTMRQVLFHQDSSLNFIRWLTVPPTKWFRWVSFFRQTRRKTVPSSAECLNVFQFFVRNSLAVNHVSMYDVSSCQKDGKNLRIVSLCPNRIFVLRWLGTLQTWEILWNFFHDLRRPISTQQKLYWSLEDLWWTFLWSFIIFCPPIRSA